MNSYKKGVFTPRVKIKHVGTWKTKIIDNSDYTSKALFASVKNVENSTIIFRSIKTGISKVG
jgi:hypothetical protein